MEQPVSLRDKIRNINSERDLIIGLIKFPEAIFEVEPFLSEQDFYSPVTSKIYCLVTDLLVREQVKRIDSALLLNKISVCNYTFGPDVNITNWIQSLTKNPSDISYETVVSLAKTIKLYSIRREIYDGGTKLQKSMIDNHNFGSIGEVISVADEVYFDMVQNFTLSEDMEQLGAGAGEYLHKLADNPIESVGFSSGFKFYDELIGNFRPDSFNFVSARAKTGKSIFGLNVATHVAMNEKLPVFYADSEMGRTMVRDRLISHVAGVDIYFIETGNWKRNPEICQKVLDAIKIVEALPIQYFSIRATNTQAFISACRRFLFRYVKRNSQQEWNKCLIVWDYIKNDYYEQSKNDAWWLNIAKSVVTFKDFASEAKIASFVLGQSNREGIAKMDKNGKMVTTDNESTVAGSDEILKTASNISQLRFKTNEEISRDGTANGDTLLIPYACRSGAGGAWLQLTPGVYEREYVCFERKAKQMTFKELTTNRIIRANQSISSALKSK